MRGQGSDVVIIDEMAYVKPILFYDIILPLFGVEKTTFVGISTQSGSWNFFTQLLGLQGEDGVNIFNTHVVRMVCDRCLSRRDPDKCDHMAHELPPWKKGEKDKYVRAIYGDQKQSLRAEHLGIIDGAEKCIFPVEGIKALRELPYFNYREFMYRKPSYVFVACDPNGGGPNHTALTAIIRYAGRIVVRFFW